MPALTTQLKLAVSLALLMAVSTLAHGRPFTVRARTEVTLELVRDADGLHVTGRLADDQGTPVASERVHLDLAGLPSRTLTTNADGTFAVVLGTDDLRLLEAMGGQRLRWSLRYAGDRVYGDARREGALDLRTQSTRLRVEAEPAITGLDDGEIRVFADLSTAATGAAIQGADVRVRVGDGTELIGATNDVGRATFIIRAGLLGSAGHYEIEARFLGDSVHAAAEATTLLRVLLPSRLTLRVGREGDAVRGRYRFSGRLSDTDGGVSDATVAIVVRPKGGSPGVGAARTLTTTRPDGVYLAALPASTLADLGPGDIEVYALFSPSAWHVGARSRMVAVKLPAPPGVPTHWYLTLGAVVVALLFFAQAVRLGLLRAGWDRLRDAFRRRPAIPHLAVESGDGPAFIEVAAAPRSERELRSSALCGRVVDAHSAEAVPFAKVSVHQEGRSEAITVTTDHNGAFDLGELPAGLVHVRAAAVGYLPRAQQVAFPHGGLLDGADLRIIAVRRKIRDIYADVVARYGSEMAWGLDTPTEAQTRMHASTPRERAAAGKVRRLVEQAWFGDQPAEVSAVRTAETLAHDLEGTR